MTAARGGAASGAGPGPSPALPAPTAEVYGVNVNRLFNDNAYTLAQIAATAGGGTWHRGDGRSQRRLVGDHRAPGAGGRAAPL